jgi:hypothetical protein
MPWQYPQRSGMEVGTTTAQQTAISVKLLFDSNNPTHTKCLTLVHTMISRNEIVKEAHEKSWRASMHQVCSAKKSDCTCRNRGGVHWVRTTSMGSGAVWIDCRFRGVPNEPVHLREITVRLSHGQLIQSTGNKKLASAQPTSPASYPPPLHLARTRSRQSSPSST